MCMEKQLGFMDESDLGRGPNLTLSPSQQQRSAAEDIDFGEGVVITREQNALNHESVPLFEKTEDQRQPDLASSCLE